MMKPPALKMMIIIALLFVLAFSSRSITALQSSTDTLTFTAVGDFGASDNTAAVLDTIAASGASFHLALGDLSYGDLRPESNWCDFVKSHVGSEFPFELIAGNHDSGLNAYEEVSPILLPVLRIKSERSPARMGKNIILIIRPLLRLHDLS